MKNKVNISLQVLPSGKGIDPYKIVDTAISVIARSGLLYKVCPFETVMEGDYDSIMETIKKVHEACLEEGADSIFANVKMQIVKDKDVAIADKTAKYN
ncbi:MAG: thiamine-binding protein [Bacteroidales bacterium]|nr:thiamine-binding protein [Bacteroidales bacterium]